MFGRQTSPESTPTPATPVGGLPRTPENTSPSKYSSTIGPDLIITGSDIALICKSSLLIAGEVKGDVNGDAVTVSKNGRVTGTITARSIDVYGEVNGALRTSAATLHASAHVNGDIIQQNLVIKEGAHFDGNVRLAKDAQEVEPQLDPTALKSQS